MTSNSKSNNINRGFYSRKKNLKSPQKNHPFTLFLIAFTFLVGFHSSAQTSLQQREIALTSLVVLKNENNFLPIKSLNIRKMASLAIGVDSFTHFQEISSLYTKISHFSLSVGDSNKQVSSIKEALKSYNLVLVSLHCPFDSLEEATRNLMSELATSQKAIIVILQPAKEMIGWDFIEKSKGLIIAQTNSELAQSLSAQLIFGGVSANGKLNVEITEKFKKGAGLELMESNRFSYTIPQKIGLDSAKLHIKLDSIAQLAIDVEATPGIQVLIAKDGKVFFHKAYGHHTYDKNREILLTDLYDLASITKIAGPLPALMKLYDERKFKLDRNLSNYWASWQKGNKRTLKVREILAHQAGLRDWIPYWRKTVKKNGEYKRKHYLTDSTEIFNTRVAKGLWLHKDFKQNIYEQIRKSKVSKEKKYLYSGLSFFIFPAVIETLTGESYETHLKEKFYKPLGANSLTFNAIDEYELETIIPSETDTFFRKQELRGIVNDESAAMMGGVSGNAGLFSNANDLAKLMQLYLQFGEYGGERYFSEETVKEFTKQQFRGNRRGAGFDKPALTEEIRNNGTPSPDASPQSFGHTGYTGTFAWADPENGLLFIFLANRTYPTRASKNLYRYNIRTAMHQVVYDLLEEVE
jgi:beta-N-acetylhexosaminidase